MLALMLGACSGGFDTKGCALAIEQASAPDAGQEQYAALLSYSERAVDYFKGITEKMSKCESREEIEALYKDPKNEEISSQLQQMSVILQIAPLDEENRKRNEALKAKTMEVVQAMITIAMKHGS